MRLISGIRMSVNGKPAACDLNEAAKREHVLYFDDVLGLYQAAIADSDLNVAAVMRLG